MVPTYHVLDTVPQVWRLPVSPEQSLNYAKYFALAPLFRVLLDNNKMQDKDTHLALFSQHAKDILQSVVVGLDTLDGFTGPVVQRQLCSKCFCPPFAASR
jgi:hypothetical protein